MTVENIDSKEIIEIIPVSFNFSRYFSTPIDNVTVSISVISGVDAGVANMLFGVHQLDGYTVTQLIRNGVSGVKYQIRVVAASGNLKYSLRANMLVNE